MVDITYRPMELCALIFQARLKTGPPSQFSLLLLFPWCLLFCCPVIVVIVIVMSAVSILVNVDSGLLVKENSSK